LWAFQTFFKAPPKSFILRLLSRHTGARKLFFLHCMSMSMEKQMGKQTTQRVEDIFLKTFCWMKIQNSIYFAMTALKKIACLSQSKFLFRSFEVRFGLSGFSTSPNVFESSNIIELSNVVESSCESVDIQQLPLSNFIWDKSVKNHGDKIALVCSPDYVNLFVFQ
jgi:hypothetical protein